MRRCVLTLTTISLVLALGTPSAAHAQFGDLSKLFENFTDLSVFGSGDWGLSRQRTLTPYNGASRKTPEASFGTEFLWEVKRLPMRAGKDSAAARRRREARLRKQDRRASLDTEGEARPSACTPFDSNKTTEVSIATRAGSATLRDTTWKFAGRDCTPKQEDGAIVELGLAYTLSNRMVGSGGLSAVVRELPRIGIYVSSLKFENFTPYWGLTVGLSKLDDIRITGTTGDTQSGTADAMTGGIALGVGFDKIPSEDSPFTVFAEVSVEASSYSTIKWADVNKVPATAPKRIDLHRASLSIGVQLKVRDKKP